MSSSSSSSTATSLTNSMNSTLDRLSKMALHSSILGAWKAEVCQAVSSNSSARLYDMLMLATRQQLGEINITSASVSSSAVDLALNFYQRARVTLTGQEVGAPSLSVEEYMRSINESTGRDGGSYVAFGEASSSSSSASSASSSAANAAATFPSNAYAKENGSPNLHAQFHPSSSSSPASAGTVAASYISSGITSISSLFSSSKPAEGASGYRDMNEQTINKQSSSSSSSPSSSPPAYTPPSFSGQQSDASSASSYQPPNSDSLLSSTSPHSLQTNAPYQPPSSSSSSAAYQPPSSSSSSSSPSPSSSSSPSPPPPSSSNSFRPPSSHSQPEFSASTLPININTLWIGSESLLMFASKQDQTQIILMLHQAGADLELCDSLGWSALHHAAAAGCVRSVKALLDLGSDALAHSKLGLTPAQCATHPEIRRELECEEAARRTGIEQQIAAIITAQQRLPSYSEGGNTMIAQNAKPSVFHVNLYQVIVPIEVRAGSRFEVSYRCPPRHSASDCLCVYYCDEKTPSAMHARIGRSIYLPDRPPKQGDQFSKMIIHAEEKMLPPGTYRLLYYNATDATFPAASNMFRVVALPSSGKPSSSLASWFDPSAWRDNYSSQPIDLTRAISATPIILHPHFQTLSELTPENISLYTAPLPPYFLFSFTLNPHAVRLALELDSRLTDLRDRLVPVRLTEKDFWQAYFYLMLRLDFIAIEEERGRRRATTTASISAPVSPATNSRASMLQYSSLPPSSHPVVAPIIDSPLLNDGPILNTPK